jgi:hypothetical protein
MGQFDEFSDTYLQQLIDEQEAIYAKHGGEEGDAPGQPTVDQFRAAMEANPGLGSLFIRAGTTRVELRSGGVPPTTEQQEIVT